MKKYFLLFVVSTGFGISHAVAQSAVTTGKTQTAAVTVPDSLSRSENNSHGTISRAGKNQQSVYTPPANTNAPASDTPASPAQQASPLKEQAASIDPKK